MITDTSKAPPTSGDVVPSSEAAQPLNAQQEPRRELDLKSLSGGSPTHLESSSEERSLASIAVEDVLRDWVGSLCHLFRPYPAVLVFLPAESGFALGAYSNGAAFQLETIEMFGNALGENLKPRITRDSELQSASNSSVEGGARVFSDLAEFNEWAGLTECGMMGGQVALHVTQAGQDEMVAVVILPTEQTFADLELRALSHIGGEKARALAGICASDRASTPQPNVDPDTAQAVPESAPQAPATSRRRRTIALTNVKPFKSKGVLSTSEVGEILGISRQTVARMFDRGEIEGFKVPGSRFRRIPGDELRKFIRQIRKQRSDGER